MKNQKRWQFIKGITIFALAVIFGFSIAACQDGGNDGNDGGGSDTNSIVGKWYTTQEAANAGTNVAAYEFKSDGKLLVGGTDQGFTYTVSGDTLTTKASGQTMGTTTFSISGTVLTLTDACPPIVKMPYYKAGSSSVIVDDDSSVVTYMGYTDSPSYKEYTLTITTTNGNSSYELTVVSSGVSKISRGTAVQSGGQYKWTLTPQNGGPFNVQLSSSGIILISDLITFTDGNYETGPGTLTPSYSGSGIFIILNSVTANETATQLTLTFDKAITGLSASDITLSGISGINKGTLSGSNPYYLPVSNISSGGTLSVTVAKSGYGIYGSPKTINLYIYITSTSGIEMVQIPGGTFQMGSESGDSDEKPVHTVTLTAFKMGKYEVTQEQWQAVMGSNPSYFSSNPASGEIQSKRPVEYVSWYDAIVFCNKLSMKEGLSPAYSISGSTDPSTWGSVPTSSNSTWNAVTIVAGSTGYRLPTEAQWEYACRAGTTTAYNTGDTISDNTGWYSSNSGSKTHEVGKKPANAFGLYDMHGNVWEWCWDWYGSYSSSAQTDPQGASSGSYRVLRGGSWNHSAGYVRSAYRYNYNPYYSHIYFGFRLARP